MVKTLTFIFITLFSSLWGFSQNYFQQEVNYKINVRLDDENNYLYADETIEYVNNSPDTLHFIYFHLWPNAYKNAETAFAKQNDNILRGNFYKTPEYERGYIDGLDFTVDSQKIEWKIDSINIDICKLILKTPLFPNQKITISTPFYVKIPLNISRFGCEEQSYQISQWYPKPAVYDLKGWHAMPYLDMGEFYSEYGNFDVSITIPKNYVVAATGNLQTKSEIQFLDSLANLNSQKSKISNNIEFPKSDSLTKTIKFTEKNIHDFAWFADKRYNVLKGTVILPNSKDTVTTWSFYTNLNAKIWRKSLEYVNDAVYNYSLWIGDYPYENCTAVEGGIYEGGGMEYPTITVIGDYKNDFMLESVIIHEVGHNWFYGILGSNERDYPWMDEGLNSAYELRYIETKYPKKQLLRSSSKFNFPYRKYYEKNYQIFSKKNIDQECNLSSEEFTRSNYTNILYFKNAFIFNYLKNYLGEAEFDRIMKIYFEKWKFKHPQPNDLINIFKENSKDNLNWFFDDLLQTRKRIDYKISSLHKNELKVKNIGNVEAPFNISLLKNDSLINSFWYKAIPKSDKISIPNFDYDKIVIDYEQIMPDVNKNNNYIYKSGIIKKRKQLNFSFPSNYQNPEKQTIYYLPALAFNNYDKTLLGVLLFNSPLMNKKFEYFIMPLYSLEKNKINGEVRFNFNIFPDNNNFQYLTLSLSGAKYSIGENYFARLKSEINVRFRSNPFNKKIENRILFNNIFASKLEELIYNDTNVYSYYFNLKYLYSKPNNYSLIAHFQGNQYFVKSSLELKYKIKYQNQKRGVEFRLFAGKFLYNSSTYYGNYNFRLSGQNGSQDYTYVNYFIGRMEQLNTNNHEPILTQQFIKNDGGFAIYSNLGQTNNWITTLNTSINFPGKLPFRFYINMGTYAGAGNNSFSKPIATETGIEFSTNPDIFAIYFPLIISEDIRNNVNNFITDKYLEKIRFCINFNELNIFTKIKDRY